MQVITRVELTEACASDAQPTMPILEDLASRQQQRQELVAERNAGTQAATGLFIQYLDADDLIAPKKLQLQAEALERSAADVVYGDWHELRTHKDKKTVLGRTYKRELKDPEIDLFTDFWCSPAAYLFRSLL